jgi:hypothetical protein
LSLAVASLWPGVFADLDFFMDDRSLYEDDNELTALGLMFSCVPFVLLFASAITLRHAPFLAACMFPIALISIWNTSIVSWIDFNRLGLGASSKADVDYLEWNKIGIWIGMLLISCVLVILVDWILSCLVRGWTRLRRNYMGKSNPAID